MKYYFESSYRPFYQLPYCCVPATLQWILYRRKLDILDQETIGTELGLKLPKKAKILYKNKKIKFLSTESGDGFGTQIEKKKYSINNFFKKYKIPLKISKEYYFKDKRLLKKFIVEQLQVSNDIIIRYNNQITKPEGSKGIGHFSLIVEIDDSSNLAILGDPEPPFFKQVTLEKILLAISPKIDGIQRGFYVVSKVQPFIIRNYFKK